MFRHCLFAFRIAAPAATALILAAFSACGTVRSATASDGRWQAAEISTAQRVHPEQRNPLPSNAATAPGQWTASRARSTGVTPAVPAASVTRENEAEPPQDNLESAPIASGRQPHWQLPNAPADFNSPAASQVSWATSPDTPRVASADAPREPRDFLAPTDAQPLSGPDTLRRNAPPSYQTPPPQAPAAQTSGSMIRGRNLPSNIRTHASLRTGRSHHTATSARRNRSRRKRTPSLWDTMTVAFQEPEQVTIEPENLPLPGRANGTTQRDETHVELMPELDGPTEFDGGYMPGDHPIGPHCGEGCCGEGVCEPGCAGQCGGGIDCGCEPGCGCASADGHAEDLFCVGCDDDESCHSVRIRVPRWQEFEAFGGVHGFKGPYDQARDSGNFGFHEGFNIGFKVPFSQAGYQLGYRAVHSQLNGDKDTNIADPHTQQFFTAGIFQRVKDGAQYGIAWDVLRDERFGAVDFHQLRGELSMIDRGCHEIGLALAVHLNDHEPFPANDETPSVLFQPTDQYLLFYRLHVHRGGEGRVYIGINDDDDGILGADMLVPLHDRWSLQTGFTYLIPEEHAGQEGAAHEAWNISTGLVWHWDNRARKSHSNCYRPLFNVADNGSLIIDERPGAPATD